MLWPLCCVDATIDATVSASVSISPASMLTSPDQDPRSIGSSTLESIKVGDKNHGQYLVFFRDIDKRRDAHVGWFCEPRWWNPRSHHGRDLSGKEKEKEPVKMMLFRGHGVKAAVCLVCSGTRHCSPSTLYYTVYVWSGKFCKNICPPSCSTLCRGKQRPWVCTTFM